MVADIPEEYGALGSLCKAVAVSERRCILRCPPSIEMTALVSSQAGPTPATVLAKSRLVVQSAGSDRQALHKVRGAPANRGVALQGELLQEFLMAEDRVGRSVSFKRPDQTELLLGSHRSSQQPNDFSTGMRLLSLVSLAGNPVPFGWLRSGPERAVRHRMKESFAQNTVPSRSVFRLEHGRPVGLTSAVLQRGFRASGRTEPGWASFARTVLFVFNCAGPFLAHLR